MKTVRPFKKYIAIFVIPVLLYAIFLFFSQPEVKYTGRAPSPSGKNHATYSAEYSNFLGCFSDTNVKLNNEYILILDYTTSIFLDWVDDQHLNIVIPLTENAYFADYNNDLDYHVQKYLPSYNGIKITINGKTYKARVSEYINAECVGVLNSEIFRLFPIKE